ncbi:MAG: sulfatase-like hydrolase/transferase, partial [Candidatus Eisenbacteria bacterium]|nr:sulfatase-like hydrolase/transferase [Candidatus Eisenbacteria bacterium]
MKRAMQFMADRSRWENSRRPRGARTVWPALLPVLVLVAWGAAGCDQTPPPATESIPEPPAADPGELYAWRTDLPRRAWNVLILTLDTTRRDVLGVYGGAVATPVLDSLAQEGVLLEDVVTPVPTTLAAHTSLMTGLDPQEHGVRHNGLYNVADSLTTLAERFTRHGYTTAAFVSGYPLHPQFGIAQGFEHYDAEFTHNAFGVARETAERTAGAVTDAALEWSSTNLHAPYFLWVHYFDPHFPYEPPEPFRSRYAGDLYAGEVAYMDREIGRLLRGLRSAERLHETVLLIVGDHGESLGEHGEPTHGFFIYEATQVVPCILVTPPEARELAEGMADRSGSLRLRDLAPTLANLLGWPGAEWREAGSCSFLSLAPDSLPPPVAYLETLVPALEYGWSDLRGVRSAGWKYIRAPQAELYDLRHDPGEQQNVLKEHPETAQRLEAWLDWYLTAESEEALEPVDLDAQVLERLRSLGYLSGDVGEDAGSGADPKDRIEVHRVYNEARQLAADHRFEEATRAMRWVLRREPQFAAARSQLADFTMRAGDPEAARRIYAELAEKDPDNREYRLGQVRAALSAEQFLN